MGQAGTGSSAWQDRQGTPWDRQGTPWDKWAMPRVAGKPARAMGHLEPRWERREEERAVGQRAGGQPL